MAWPKYQKTESGWQELQQRRQKLDFPSRQLLILCNGRVSLGELRAQFGPRTDGLLQGVIFLVRVVLLYYWTSTLMFVTPLMDLADGLEVMFDPLKRLRVPVNELVMVAVIALKFVPLLVAEIERPAALLHGAELSPQSEDRKDEM